MSLFLGLQKYSEDLCSFDCIHQRVVQLHGKEKITIDHLDNEGKHPLQIGGRLLCIGKHAQMFNKKMQLLLWNSLKCVTRSFKGNFRWKLFLVLNWQ